MPYIGQNLQVAYPTYKNIDDISGSFNGSTTSFALLVSGAAPVPLPLNSQQCLISVGGVIQRPDDTGSEGFRLSGGNIVFSSAPSTGEDFFGIILAGADYVNVGANFPDGSVGVPSITFEQDSDTGFYRSGSGIVSFSSNSVQTAILGSNSLTAPSFIPTSSTVPTNGVYLPAANSVGLSTNSTERLRINSLGNVGIGTSSPGEKLTVAGNISLSAAQPYIALIDSIWGAGCVFRSGVNTLGTATGDYQLFNVPTGKGFAFAQNNATNSLVIDSSGRLLVGTSSARSFFSGLDIPAFQVEGTSTQGREISVTSSTNNVDGAVFLLGKQRSGTLGGNTIVQNGDQIGYLGYQASDGTNMLPAASIVAAVDGTPGTNDMPGRLVFSVTADGASSPSTAMTINQNRTLTCEADIFVKGGLFVSDPITTNRYLYKASSGGGTATVYIGNEIGRAHY